MKPVHCYHHRLNTKLRFTAKSQKANKDYNKFTQWMFNLRDRSRHNKTVGGAVLSSGNDYLENKVCS